MKKELNVKCLGKKFLVKADPDDEKTSGGIFIVRNEKEVCKKGSIVSVGSKSVMKLGQKVMFRTYALKTIKHELEEYFVVPDNSVLVVFNKKAPLGVTLTKNRVLVEDLPKPETTKSGIFLQQDKEDVRAGIVLECNTEELSVKTGDLIVYNHDVGVKIDLKGKKYLVMGTDHIMAVAEGNKNVQVS